MFGTVSWDSEDAEKGLTLGPFLGRFNSIKMFGKKGSVSLVDYKILEKATNNFLESNILGEGGFGCVYKARMEDNLLVAVKKLDCGSQDAVREFEVPFSYEKKKKKKDFWKVFQNFPSFVILKFSDLLLIDLLYPSGIAE